MLASTLGRVIVALALATASVAYAQGPVPPAAHPAPVPTSHVPRPVIAPPATHPAAVALHLAPKSPPPPVLHAEIALPTPRIASVKTIIFDWDGTIGDTFSQLKYAASRAFKDIGVTPVAATPGEDPYKSIIDAQGLDGMCKRGLPNATPEQIKQWTDRFNFHQRNAPDELVMMKAGARAELDALKQRYPGTKFAVLSARPQEVLEKMIRLTGSSELFDVVVGTADSKIAPKPAPDGVVAILSRLSVHPKDALMVGDHENDILAGKAAGTKTVALTDGLGHADALASAKPDFVLDHLDLTGRVFRLPAKPTPSVVARP